MKLKYFSRTICMIGIIVIYSISTTMAQTVSGEIKISEKSDLSQKSRSSSQKNKKQKTKRKKNGKKGKKKLRLSKKKKTKNQQVAM